MPESGFLYEIGIVLELKVEADVTNRDLDITKTLLKGSKWEVIDYNSSLRPGEHFYELRLYSNSVTPSEDYTLLLLRSLVDSQEFFEVFDEFSLRREKEWSILREIGGIPYNFVVPENPETRH